MVVSQFHFMRVAVVPSKANAPLSINTNAGLSGTISFRFPQSIVRGNSQLGQRLGIVDHSEFSSRGALHFSWQRPNGEPSPNLFRGFRAERPASYVSDHQARVAFIGVHLEPAFLVQRERMIVVRYH